MWVKGGIDYMGTKVIVLVSDRDDPKHGEISVLDDSRKAERLVETLLEAGFEQDRIRIFNGSELDMQITHRPVVSLLGEPGDEPEESPSQEPAEPEEAALEIEAAVEQEAEAPAEAFVQNGVRFSSLFRGA